MQLEQVIERAIEKSLLERHLLTEDGMLTGLLKKAGSSLVDFYIMKSAITKTLLDKKLILPLAKAIGEVIADKQRKELMRFTQPGVPRAILNTGATAKPIRGFRFNTVYQPIKQ